MLSDVKMTYAMQSNNIYYALVYNIPAVDKNANAKK